MADTRVPFWPPLTDCLAWSADCELAIPGSDYVQVLVQGTISRLVYSGDGTDSSHS